MEKISFKEYVKKRLESGKGSYLFLMIFQDYCQRALLNKEMTYEEWDQLLEEFGNRPSKDLFDNWF